MTKLMYALLALLIAVLVGIGVLYIQGANIDSRTSDQAEILHELRAAETSRECQTQAANIQLAAIVDLMADNFATPPYPDPERVKAVEGMRAAATFFRSPHASTC